MASEEVRKYQWTPARRSDGTKYRVACRVQMDGLSPSRDGTIDLICREHRGAARVSRTISWGTLKSHASLGQVEVTQQGSQQSRGSRRSGIVMYFFKRHRLEAFEIIVMVVFCAFFDFSTGRAQDAENCGGYDAIEVNYLGVDHSVVPSNPDNPIGIKGVMPIVISISKAESLIVDKFIWRNAGRRSRISLCIDGKPMSDETIGIPFSEIGKFSILASIEEAVQIEKK
jgi:hypothetical protein